MCLSTNYWLCYKSAYASTFIYPSIKGRPRYRKHTMSLTVIACICVLKLRQGTSDKDSVDIVLLRGWLDKKRSKFPRYYQKRYCVIKQCQREGTFHDIYFEYYDSHPGNTRKRPDPLGWVDITNSKRPETTRNELTVYGKQMNKDRSRVYVFRADGVAAALLWKASINFGINSVHEMTNAAEADSQRNKMRISPNKNLGGDEDPLDPSSRAMRNHVNRNMDIHSPASLMMSAQPTNPRIQGGRRRNTLQVDILDDPSMSDARDDLDALQLAGHGGGKKEKTENEGDMCGPSKYTFEYCIKPGFDPIDKEYRKECQDSACLIEEFGTREDPFAFVGVFDGHGQNGRKVSSFVKLQFPKMLQEHSSYPHDMSRVYRDCTLEIEEQLKKQEFDVRLSGTTGTYMVMNDGVAHVGWCGDSRAVLGYFDKQTQSYKSFDLTTDHKPGDELERTRIESYGGMVMKVGSVDSEADNGIPARVFDKVRPHFGPGIAMSRSIGDTNATSLGVLPEPDYYKHTISPEDGFMIFASDGLWEVFTSDEAVEWVTKYLKQMEIKGIVPGQTSETNHLIASQNLAV